MNQLLGCYAFLIGLGVAVLVGLFPVAFAGPDISLLMVLLGLIVGFMNIQTKEVKHFLLAALTLLVAGGAGLNTITVMNLGWYLGNILSNVTFFIAPAAVVVALKSILLLAKD